MGYNSQALAALYVVASPIGNLEDISLRALRILREVKLIAAEDTRTTRHLLSAYNIKTPVTSYHGHTTQAKLDYLLSCLQTQDVALVSEAGMPGLSDPGYDLITAAIKQGLPVVPIPGPSAVITALVVSGLPCEQFLYLGFLPRRPRQRRQLLASITNEPRTIVFFEAPHRLKETLSDIGDILGDRRIAVCRELTKVHEEVFRGKVAQAMDHFSEPKGEFTLVLEGKGKEEAVVTGECEAQLWELYKQGVGAKEAVAQVSEATGLPRKRLYQTWIKLVKGG